MATSGEDSNPCDRATSQPLAQLQELGPRVARRRLSQARHRATMAGLFSNLREIVFSQSELKTSKWQVLNKAKNHIEELEQILDNLLKVKESFNLDDGNANSLEAVKEEYAKIYFRNPSQVSNKVCQKGFGSWGSMEAGGDNAEIEEEEDGEEEKEEYQKEEETEEEQAQEEEKKVELLHPAVTLSPDLMEFERYLNFYKHMMDLLVGSRIVSSQEVSFPIVSAAISHLWQNLSDEWKASLLQAWAQKHSGAQGLTTKASQDTARAEDSGIDSQGASGSLLSTPEELLFEDAFDVANFLHKSEAPGTSIRSSVPATCNPEKPEEKFQLYMQIINFFKGLCCVNTQVKQEPDVPVDDAIIRLRCTETFDDEDL